MFTYSIIKKPIFVKINLAVIKKTVISYLFGSGSDPKLLNYVDVSSSTTSGAKLF